MPFPTCGERASRADAAPPERGQQNTAGGASPGGGRPLPRQRGMPRKERVHTGVQLFEPDHCRSSVQTDCTDVSSLARKPCATPVKTAYLTLFCLFAFFCLLRGTLTWLIFKRLVTKGPCCFGARQGQRKKGLEKLSHTSTAAGPCESICLGATHQSGAVPGPAALC